MRNTNVSHKVYRSQYQYFEIIRSLIRPMGGFPKPAIFGKEGRRPDVSSGPSTDGENRGVARQPEIRSWTERPPRRTNPDPENSARNEIRPLARPARRPVWPTMRVCEVRAPCKLKARSRDPAFDENEPGLARRLLSNRRDGPIKTSAHLRGATDGSGAANPAVRRAPPLTGHKP